MERVLVCVHIEGIDRQVVRREVERLKNLSQREFCPVTEDYDILEELLHMPKNKATSLSRQDISSFWL